MSFGDLKSESGVKSLNEYLSSRSYVSGYEPSQSDVDIYTQLGKAPASSVQHALRWYEHISSYSPAERKAFPKGEPVQTTAPLLNGSSKAAAKDDDSDVDLFGSEEEDEEAEKIKQQRLKEYAEKKSTKPGVIAKSSVVLDVKPWDDETDLKEMEKQVRTIEVDGLNWGASKLVPVGYGINKLQIMCTVVDDKVSIEELTETIEAFEDFVQSVDIAAFNKI